MRLTEAELLAWTALAPVLAKEEPTEFEFLPDFAEAAAERSSTIANQPAAFDTASALLVANSLYLAVLPAISAAYPRLVDTAVDIGKDVLKKRIEDCLDPKASSKAADPAAGDKLRAMHAAIASAAVGRGLSPEIAQQLADLAVATIAMNGTAT